MKPKSHRLDRGTFGDFVHHVHANNVPSLHLRDRDMLDLEGSNRLHKLKDSVSHEHQFSQAECGTDFNNRNMDVVVIVNHLPQHSVRLDCRPLRFCGRRHGCSLLRFSLESSGHTEGEGSESNFTSYSVETIEQEIPIPLFAEKGLDDCNFKEMNYSNIMSIELNYDEMIEQYVRSMEGTQTRETWEDMNVWDASRMMYAKRIRTELFRMCTNARGELGAALGEEIRRDVLIARKSLRAPDAPNGVLGDILTQHWDGKGKDEVGDGINLMAAHAAYKMHTFENVSAWKSQIAAMEQIQEVDMFALSERSLAEVMPQLMYPYAMLMNDVRHKPNVGRDRGVAKLINETRLLTKRYWNMTFPHLKTEVE